LIKVPHRFQERIRLAAWGDARIAERGKNECALKRRTQSLPRLGLRVRIPSPAPYYGLGDWLANAVAQDALNPFRAIIACTNPRLQPNILTADQLEEENLLIRVPTVAAITRDSRSLAAAMALLLRSARTVLFVDAYYDPYSDRYQTTLRECLNLIHQSNPQTVCQIHHLDGKCPSAVAI
jgi:hypothetical protein